MIPKFYFRSIPFGTKAETSPPCLSISRTIVELIAESSGVVRMNTVSTEFTMALFI